MTKGQEELPCLDKLILKLVGAAGDLTKDQIVNLSRVVRDEVISAKQEVAREITSEILSAIHDEGIEIMDTAILCNTFDELAVKYHL